MTRRTLNVYSNTLTPEIMYWTKIAATATFQVKTLLISAFCSNQNFTNIVFCVRA